MKHSICLAFGLTVICVAGLSHGSVISDLIDFKDDPLQEHDSAAKDEEFGSRKKRAIGAVTATLISAGIAAGTSLIGTTTSALQAQTGFVVTVGIEMENYSKWLLADPRARNHWGQIAVPPTSVKPRTKETMIAHKTGHLATGTSGVASWRFAKGGRAYRIIVMWSVPYNQDHYSNWLGLGIRPEQSTDPAFNDMYYRTDDSWFVKKDFYHNTNTLKFCKFGVCVSGAMGTTHKPRVIVRFIPQSIDDLAIGLKDMIDG
ncbi:unnamed protein product [Owenia fusiformis]|uniref:Uncharacterized protein n=1 Tax=Owenia fusiformis TaxID=6347 RepID=A0A8J1UTU7_OWEFU|nr:unnamed protein product [Owenia fusiformis]